jgi:hypothetical protein
MPVRTCKSPGTCTSYAANGTRPSTRSHRGGPRTARRRTRRAWTGWHGRLRTGPPPNMAAARAPRWDSLVTSARAVAATPAASPPARSGSNPIATTSPCQGSAASAPMSPLGSLPAAWSRAPPGSCRRRSPGRTAAGSCRLAARSNAPSAAPSGQGRGSALTWESGSWRCCPTVVESPTPRPCRPPSGGCGG